MIKDSEGSATVQNKIVRTILITVRQWENQTNRKRFPVKNLFNFRSHQSFAGSFTHKLFAMFPLSCWNTKRILTCRNKSRSRGRNRRKAQCKLASRYFLRHSRSKASTNDHPRIWPTKSCSLPDSCCCCRCDMLERTGRKGCVSLLTLQNVDGFAHSLPYSNPFPTLCATLQLIYKSPTHSLSMQTTQSHLLQPPSCNKCLTAINIQNVCILLFFSPSSGNYSPAANTLVFNLPNK